MEKNVPVRQYLKEKVSVIQNLYHLTDFKRLKSSVFQQNKKDKSSHYMTITN